MNQDFIKQINIVPPIFCISLKYNQQQNEYNNHVGKPSNN